MENCYLKKKLIKTENDFSNKQKKIIHEKKQLGFFNGDWAIFGWFLSGMIGGFFKRVIRSGYFHGQRLTGFFRFLKSNLNLTDGARCYRRIFY